MLKVFIRLRGVLHTKKTKSRVCDNDKVLEVVNAIITYIAKDITLLIFFMSQL